MRILAVSDLHLQPLDALAPVLRRLRPDLLVYAGDGCARFGTIPDAVLIDAAAAVLHKARLQSCFVWTPLARNGRALVLGADGRCRRCRVGEAWRVQLGFCGDEPDITVHARPADANAPAKSCRVVHGLTLAFHVVPRGVPRAGDWCQLVDRVPLGVVAVLGNDAHPLDTHALQTAGVHDVERAPHAAGPVTFIGIGGAPRDGELAVDNGYLYSEAEALGQLRRQLDQVGDRPVVLISHAPPRGVLDVARHGGLHRAGSTAVACAATDPRVSLVVCGHVHRCGGRRERFEAAEVVNVASEASLGAPLRYSLITLDEADGTVVDVEQGEQHFGDPLRQLVNVGAYNADRLRGAGFGSVENVAAGDEQLLRQAVGPQRGPQLKAHAQALLRQRPVVLKTFSPPNQKLVLLDIETDVDTMDRPWLIGVLDPRREKTTQLVELHDAKMPAHLRLLDRVLSRHPSAYIATWGHFDRSALERAHRHFGLRLPHWLDPRRWWDFHRWIGDRVAFPYTDTRLATISAHFGFARRHPDLRGGEVGAMYSLWRAGREDAVDLKIACEHNHDDLLALRAVIDGLSTLIGLPGAVGRAA